MALLAGKTNFILKSVVFPFVPSLFPQIQMRTTQSLLMGKLKVKLSKWLNSSLAYIAHDLAVECFASDPSYRCLLDDVKFWFHDTHGNTVEKVG